MRETCPIIESTDEMLGLSLFDKIKLLFRVWLLKLKIVKYIVSIKEIVLSPDYAEDIFSDAKPRDANGIKYKIAIDSSGQPRFWLNGSDTIYRLDVSIGFRNDKSVRKFAPILKDFFSMCDNDAKKMKQYYTEYIPRNEILQ